MVVELWPQNRIFVPQEAVLPQTNVAIKEVRLRNPRRVRGRYDSPTFRPVGQEPVTVPEVRHSIEMAKFCIAHFRDRPTKRRKRWSSHTFSLGKSVQDRPTRRGFKPRTPADIPYGLNAFCRVGRIHAHLDR